MNILTISEDALKIILDEKLGIIDRKIDFLSDQNLQLKKTISNLLKKSNPEEILTTKEVAKIMKVQETTVRTWCKNNLIAYQKSGNNYRIKRSSIEEYRKRGLN